MPTVLYLRGCPGSGKNTVARILERDLGWPRLWNHHFDSLYRVIGDHRVPRLTDRLMNVAAAHLMESGRDLLVVRPSREAESVAEMAAVARIFQYAFVPVCLTADRKTLETRVTRRWHESPFRITTKAALDEYLDARPEEPYPGEHVIDTTDLEPEQVAGRVKELLPERNGCVKELLP